MGKRGWTQEEMEEAIRDGKSSPSKNLRTGNPATVFEHPATGKPLVVDNVTGEIIQVGEKGFRYDNYLP